MHLPERFRREFPRTADARIYGKAQGTIYLDNRKAGSGDAYISQSALYVEYGGMFAGRKRFRIPYEELTDYGVGKGKFGQICFQFKTDKINFQILMRKSGNDVERFGQLLIDLEERREREQSPEANDGIQEDRPATSRGGLSTDEIMAKVNAALDKVAAWEQHHASNGVPLPGMQPMEDVLNHNENMAVAIAQTIDQFEAQGFDTRYEPVMRTILRRTGYLSARGLGLVNNFREYAENPDEATRFMDLEPDAAEEGVDAYAFAHLMITGWELDQVPEVAEHEEAAIEMRDRVLGADAHLLGRVAEMIAELSQAGRSFDDDGIADEILRRSGYEALREQIRNQS